MKNCPRNLPNGRHGSAQVQAHGCNRGAKGNEETEKIREALPCLRLNVHAHDTCVPSELESAHNWMVRRSRDVRVTVVKCQPPVPMLTEHWYWRLARCNYLVVETLALLKPLVL